MHFFFFKGFKDLTDTNICSVVMLTSLSWKFQPFLRDLQERSPILFKVKPFSTLQLFKIVGKLSQFSRYCCVNKGLDLKKVCEKPGESHRVVAHFPVTFNNILIGITSSGDNLFINTPFHRHSLKHLFLFNSSFMCFAILMLV